MNDRQFLLGCRSAVPIVMGYLPLGFAYGVLAREAGLNLFETTLMSILVYAGSAQFIAVSLIGLGATTAAIVFTTFLVNLRHLLMSASLAPHLKSLSFFKLGFLSFGITDETYAVAISHYSRNKATPTFKLGLNLTAHAGWIGGSFLGGAAGQLIPDTSAFGLNFALPAMFICLLIFQLKNRATLLVALLAGVLSLVISSYIPGNWNIILATIISASLGVFIEKWMTKSSSSSSEWLS